MSRTPKPAALLLVGHGSHYSLESSRPVHDLARAARDLGEFAEVRVAFWKEEPFLHHAFDLIESAAVLVVPIFTSLGYFTERVVPRELGLEGAVTVKDGRRIHYLAPIGPRPEMAGIVLDRAREALGASARSSETTLVVLGHGTDEHSGSGGVTYDIAARIASEGAYAAVVPAFLDQDPMLVEALTGVATRAAVVVPFFVSEGWHVGTTIPRDLVRAGGARGVEGGDPRVIYAKPVGTHTGVSSLVMTAAREAFAALDTTVGLGSDLSSAGGPAGVARSREWFTGWVRAAEAPRVFLETAVWAIGDGRFEVRHHLDAQAPAGALRTLAGPQAALDLARATEEGRPRPLRTSPDLQRGWRFADLDAEGLWEVYAHLYPAAPVHVCLHAQGDLRVVPFETAARRQSGMYSGVDRLGGSELADVVHRRCGSGCLRIPVWHDTSVPEEPIAARARSECPVPCKEPCSLLISEARSTLDPSRTSG